MDLLEMLESADRVVSGLDGRMDPAVREDVTLYLETGEEALAVEFLVGALIRDRVPVSASEASTLLDLMRYFAVSPEDTETARYYPSLADPPGTVAELDVVESDRDPTGDEPSA